MADHLITREVEGHHGRYVIRQNGEEAELVYKIISPELIVAVHTGVPDSFKGTGAGVAMVNRLVADARAEGFKIVPQCPFVNSQRLKHPEWADVFAA